jgi:hypothetical protein
MQPACARYSLRALQRVQIPLPEHSSTFLPAKPRARHCHHTYKPGYGRKEGWGEAAELPPDFIEGPLPFQATLERWCPGGDENTQQAYSPLYLCTPSKEPAPLHDKEILDHTRHVQAAGTRQYTCPATRELIAHTQQPVKKASLSEMHGVNGWSEKPDHRVCTAQHHLTTDRHAWANHDQACAATGAQASMCACDNL